jgi:hypothetical protein
MKTTDALYRALEKQGNNVEEIIEILEEMSESVLNGDNPEEVLFDYGLEPDYVLDLVYYAEMESMHGTFPEYGNQDWFGEDDAWYK